MRQFDAHTTWEDVQNMTVEEAIAVLSYDADSDGKEWSARPHKAKAAQMAIEALKRIDNANSCIGCVNSKDRMPCRLDCHDCSRCYDDLYKEEENEV